MTPKLQSTYYFLMISNMRCGSTLLQFMLGELDEVGTDYEMKFEPPYQPQPIHLAIDRNTTLLKEVISNAVPKADIMGTKLVLDPFPFSPNGYDELLPVIPDDISIVHIKRTYWKILLSASRGIMHLPSQESDAKHTKAYAILLERKDPATLIDRSRGADEYLPGFMESLKHYVVFLRNDLTALQLRKNHRYYLLSYNNIKRHFPRMCTFLGIRSSKDRIAAISAAPPMQKLPPITLHSSRIGLRLIGFAFDMCFWVCYCIDSIIDVFRTKPTPSRISS